MDGVGNAYVTGATLSTDFPTLDAVQGSKNGNPDPFNFDAFVTKLDPTASGAAGLLYSTYLGGSGFDQGRGIAVDGAGSAYVTGLTASTDFPTLNAYQGSNINTNSDAFVVKIGPSNQAPIADAGLDQTVEATSGAGASVDLDGSGSSDDDGDVLTYSWTGPFGTAGGVTPSVGVPLGTHVIDLEVDDSTETDSDMVQIVVQDTTAPVVVAPSPVTVEATGAFTAVSAAILGTASATDIADPSPTVTNDAPATFPIGSTVVTWTATDASGNAGTATQNVTLLYIFGEFLPPLEGDKIYKANRTLPVKFQISYVGGEPVEEAEVGIQVVLLGDDDELGDPIDLSTNETADSGGLFRFTDGQYIYNLSTKGFAPGKYRITAFLSNGQKPYIDIGLR